jgi:hypothetical protein
MNDLNYMSIYNNRKVLCEEYWNKTNNHKDLIKDLIKYDKKILDFGCGNGSFDYSGLIVDTYDIDQENNFAKFHKLEEINKDYDVVVLNQVIEHMEHKEIFETINFLKNITNNIIFVTPNFWFFGAKYWDDYTHKRPPSIRDIVSYLDLNGFECKIIYSEKYVNPFRNLINSIICYGLNAKPYGNICIYCKKRKVLKNEFC